MFRSLFFLRLTALVAAVTVLGAGCGGKAPDPTAAQASQPVTLEMWGVVDDVGVYQNAITSYQKSHPNVRINYRRLRLEEYEQKMLEGFADDRGPDIFLIHNDWTGKYLSKIQPMPKTVKIGSLQVSGSFGKDRSWSLVEQPTITLRDYRTQYADVVAYDTIRKVGLTPPVQGGVSDVEDRIVGIPLSVDTLAMYYNKDILNKSGIFEPPTNWVDFQSQVERIVKLDQDQQSFAQMAVAMGTMNNISRGVDILTILMAQNGARMSNSAGMPTFHQTPADLATARQEPPAFSALAFYTDFANPTKATYTWNALQPEALDAFAQGKTAFYFGYAYDLPTIRARAPRLNLGMSKLPQISESNEQNMANYWFWTVAKKSKNTDVAWHFLNRLTTPESSKAILDIMKRPAARKGQLAAQLDDEDIGIFASQVLTAISWYRGNDPNAVQEAFAQLVADSMNPAVDLPVAMRNAVARIGQTIQ